MSFASRLALVAVALAGCNGLLGLDDAIDDADGDGIASAEDNCPFIANPMQRDSDGNGLGDVCDCQESGVDRDGDAIDDACDDCVGPGPTGLDRGNDGIDDGCELCPDATGADVDGDGVDDACDACLLGPPHDEDADGVADACDNCPTLPNTNQADTDGDVLGDACDTHGLNLHRVVFDGFGERDLVLWPTNVPRWSWDNDGLAGTGDAIRFSSVRIKGVVQIDTLVPTPSATGITEIGVQGVRTVATCYIDGQRKLYLAVSTPGIPGSPIAETAPIAGTEPVRMRLTADKTSKISCAAIDSNDKATDEATLPSSPLDGRVSIRTTQGGRFEYLWVVDRDQ